jgi:hypothetical protein
MKPPVSLEDIMAMWAEDSVIDETEPGRSMAKIPILHAKYLRILSYHNLLVKKLHNDYQRMKKLKFEYYNGDLNNPEDLAEHNLEPFTRKVIRQDIPMWIDADKQLTDILLKKAMHQEIAEAATSILKELHSRTFQIKGIMEWERFSGGK